MTDYTELVKALRCELHYTSCPETNCKYICHDTFCDTYRLMVDAAAAIEALNRLLDQNTQRCEALRKQLREAHESYERHLNELEAQLPKRGEWVVFNKQMLINLENAREQYKELGYPHRTELGIQCSNCRKVTYVDSGIKYEFCPHCGAKMEVQE